MIFVCTVMKLTGANFMYTTAGLGSGYKVQVKECRDAKRCADGRITAQGAQRPCRWCGGPRTRVSLVTMVTTVMLWCRPSQALYGSRKDWPIAFILGFVKPIK